MLDNDQKYWQPDSYFREELRPLSFGYNRDNQPALRFRELIHFKAESIALGSEKFYFRCHRKNSLEAQQCHNMTQTWLHSLPKGDAPFLTRHKPSSRTAASK